MHSVESERMDNQTMMKKLTSSKASAAGTKDAGGVALRGENSQIIAERDSSTDRPFMETDTWSLGGFSDCYARQEIKFAPFAEISLLFMRCSQ